MINYEPFIQTLDTINSAQGEGKLTQLLTRLPELITLGLDENRYGDLPRWKNVLEQLPNWKPDTIELDNAAICISQHQTIVNEQMQQFKTLLKGLHPWRKRSI